MILCASCGGENADGMRFCVRCGAALAPVPEPGAWRDETSESQPSVKPGYPREDFGQANPPYANPNPQGGEYQLGNMNSSTGEYRPPAPYNPPPYPAQNPGGYGQQQRTGQPMHPIVPALISFFFPGLGLLAVPNKAGLGIIIFIAYMVLSIILVMLLIGICVVPIANILLAIHSWDESAKSSNGQYQPLLFK